MFHPQRHPNAQENILDQHCETRQPSGLRFVPVLPEAQKVLVSFEHRSG
jgi:hypothetical protein